MDADHAPPTSTPPSATGQPRRPLDRDLILSTALDLIDRAGLAQLTMRRLGTELGVDPMALYHHVPGREVLLDGVTERVLAELDVAPADQTDEPMSWQEYLQRLAHGMRDVAMTHPRVFPMVATRPAGAPWLRPPMRSLWLVEQFLQVLHDAGFSDAGVAESYRAFSSFLLGHLLLESTARGAELGPHTDDETGPTGSQVTEQDYPRLVSLRPQLEEQQVVEEFELTLEALIERLDGLRSRPASAG